MQQKVFIRQFPYVIPLCKDGFGNYLIQKLCDNINQAQIKKLLEIISKNILDISSNFYGKYDYPTY